MGSLNGTLVNSHPINNPDVGSRIWGKPIDLANGDVITLGTTTKVSVSLGGPYKMKLQCTPIASCHNQLYCFDIASYIY